MGILDSILGSSNKEDDKYVIILTHDIFWLYTIISAIVLK